MRNLLIVAVLIVSVDVLLSASTGSPNTSSSKVTTETTEKPKTTKSPVTTPNIPTTTLTPAEECHNNNGSCEDCVKVGSVQCVWCESKKSCMLKEHVIPISECSLADAKWAVCWVNYEALIIACSVIGGLLILGLVVCICCCCCCKKDNSAKYAREDAKVERKKQEMKDKHTERRADRKAKTDEIRRKYGLIKDDTPYTRFENN